MSAPVFRFAPSPNGPLHLGHAYSALLNAQLAQAFGGRFLVRIEDIDTARCDPGFVTAIFNDLRWLGLAWEQPVRRQSRHLPDYLAAFETLRYLHLVYPCFCTRGEIARILAAREGEGGLPWPRDPDGAPRYPGTCRHLSRTQSAARMRRGEAHAWRLDLDASRKMVGEPLIWTCLAADGRVRRVVAEPARWGDAVIRRKDVATSYHLSVVTDDAIQGITHVVRGADLEPATDLHALLQVVMALPRPAYHHHRLILDDNGRKLSKSRGSRSLADMRRAGMTAAEIKRLLAIDSA